MYESTMRALLAVIVGCGGFGCADDDAPPTGACQVAMTRAPRSTRELTIGASQTNPPSEAFAAWEEGSSQQLIFGFQGGYMLVPQLRVPAEADDPPTELCARVDLRNKSEIPVESGFDRLQLFERDGDHWYSPELFNLLGSDLEPLIDRRVRIEVDVSAPELEASAAIEVVLSPPT